MRHQVADPAVGAITICHYRRKLDARGVAHLAMVVSPARATELSLDYLDAGVLHDIRCRINDMSLAGVIEAITRA